MLSSHKWCVCAIVFGHEGTSMLYTNSEVLYFEKNYRAHDWHSEPMLSFEGGSDVLISHYTLLIAEGHDSSVHSQAIFDHHVVFPKSVPAARMQEFTRSLCLSQKDSLERLTGHVEKLKVHCGSIQGVFSWKDSVSCRGLHLKRRFSALSEKV